MSEKTSLCPDCDGALVSATENIAQTVQRLSQWDGAPIWITAPRPAELANAVPYALVPESAKLVSLEALLPVPTRTRQRVDLHDASSFGAYVNRFKAPGTTLYADESKTTVCAVLDHAPTAEEQRWGGHTASLALRWTREWQTWWAMNGKRVGQLDFATFLEDNLPDIAEPVGAVVLDMARQLDIKKGVSFSSGVRLDNGQTQLCYTEDIQNTAAKGTLALVDTFTLGLAPFEGAPLYKVMARLRYRLQDSKLVLWFDLVRPHDVVRQAWRDVLAEIAKTTELVPFAGVTSGQVVLPTIG